MNRSKENPSSARLLMRVEKSHRLILNTRLWPSMNVERPGDKDIRFIAPSLEKEGELASYGVRVSIVEQNRIYIYYIYNLSLFCY